MRGDGRPLVIAQTNRFTAAVRKLLSIKGEERDVSFGVHLEEERPEYSFLKHEVRFSQFNEVAGAAGTLPVIGVRNPVGSGMLVVVDSCWCFVEAAGLTVILGSVGGPTAVAAASMHPMDTRWFSGGGALFATTALGLVGAVAAAGVNYIIAQQLSLGANQIMDFMTKPARVGPFIMGPGQELILKLGAVGVHTLDAYFGGYERPLESGELV